MDPFEKHARSLTSPATTHFAITPSDGTDLAIMPRVIYCTAAGNAVLRDASGTTLTYTLSAGQILPLSPLRVLATGTTATLIGWY